MVLTCFSLKGIGDIFYMYGTINSIKNQEIVTQKQADSDRRLKLGHGIPLNRRSPVEEVRNKCNYTVKTKLGAIFQPAVRLIHEYDADRH